MQKTLSLYEKVRVVPAEAKRTIPAGRLRGFTDINPMWRIKTLTEEFGVCGIGWYYDIVSQELKEGGNGEVAAFVTINLFVKIEGEWSKGIPGLGGSMFVANEKNGLYTSDECFKMALTDALGIACKSLGMAADVYFEKDRTKYDSTTQQVTHNVGNKAPVLGIEKAIAACSTQKGLTDLFRNNKELQASASFIKLLADRKKVLIENGITE